MPGNAPSDPATIHERFVGTLREIDSAYSRGRLNEWVQEELADERRRAGFDDPAGDD